MKKIIIGLFTLLSIVLIFSKDVQAVASLANFGKIDNCYYRSGQISVSDFQTLYNLKFRTIINLRTPFSFSKKNMLKQKTIANNFGINYINIPMNPSEPPSIGQINLFFSIIDNPKNLPVFVYCREGKDRTGIMTALYRVHHYHWNFNQAYAEMKAYGYHNLLFPELKNFLADYTKNLTNKITANNEKIYQ